MTLFIAIVAAVAGIALGAWLAHPSAGGSSRVVAADGEPTSGPSSVPNARVVPLDETRDLLRAAFRTEQFPDPAHAKERDAREMADALTVVAEVMGGQHAALFDVAEDGMISCIAASANEPPGTSDAENGLVRWAFTERTLVTDRSDADPRFAAAPADQNGTRLVLAVWFGADSRATREAVRAWLPRHATAIARIHELVRTRSEVARSNFRLRATVRAAMTMQGTRDPSQLGALVVAQALEVVGAAWATLVQWDAEQGHGVVRAMTKGHLGDAMTDTVPVESVVGGVCIDRVPIVYANAKPLLSDPRAVMGPVSVPERTRSLLVVPLIRSRQENSIGALVCGHEQQDWFTQSDARVAQDLGMIAAGALETAWHVAEVSAVARTDPLTGLRNRRGFDEHFSQAVTFTDREDDESFALVLMDVDHFKQVNDRYGHEAGDEVLKLVSKVLKRDRREIDTVARVGGEEFAMLLPWTTAAGAREVAERVRTRIEALEVLTGRGIINATASFGIAIYRSRSGNAASLFEKADEALYAAKHNGRNRVELASRTD